MFFESLDAELELIEPDVPDIMTGAVLAIREGELELVLALEHELMVVFVLDTVEEVVDEMDGVTLEGTVAEADDESSTPVL